ncbi:unnamed protein product [marine sediment metagenome]|uniref:Uncharacterized protein n=1 Tax=marine sediment metagenome TaxID=412755 RepID=X1KHY1_9ZZZZ
MYLPGNSSTLLNNSLPLYPPTDIQISPVRHNSSYKAEKGIDYQQGKIVSLHNPGKSLTELAQSHMSNGEEDGGTSCQENSHPFLKEKGCRHNRSEGVEQKAAVQSIGVDNQQDAKQEVAYQN